VPALRAVPPTPDSRLPTGVTMRAMSDQTIHATTVICVRRDGRVAMAGDGQVTVGNTVMKQGASKVRRLYDGAVIAGFAGSAADAFALFSRFEAKLEEYSGNIERAVVELAKDWRLDKYLRQLQAFLIVANHDRSFLISGTGDLIQPDEDGILAIGSGGAFALASAQALMKHTTLSAEEIARESLRIAAGICIYTNDNITVEMI
jgi:ATP-dependent HslUV protease, peptidase subunit HslV